MMDKAVPRCRTEALDADYDGAVSVPDYLEDNYWWAYLHPAGVRFFDQPAMVNLILWGNYRRLGQSVLEELDAHRDHAVLQLACVYGEFTPRLANHIGLGGRVSVADVAPVQLRNLSRKLDASASVDLYHQDSTCLSFSDGVFDSVVVFFLLHEQPASVRRRTLAEALRVVKPGGKLIVVDYHRPHLLNPLRWLMYPVLRGLEPFALDLWSHDVVHWFPSTATPISSRKRTYFGGLYQKLVFTRD